MSPRVHRMSEWLGTTALGSSEAASRAALRPEQSAIVNHPTLCSDLDVVLN
jgi:hypothetical protein